MLRENLQNPFAVESSIVFGEYEQRKILVDQLVMMPQVRADKNPELMNIKDSIETNGLLNPIDVAVMEEEELSQYIDFTNELWGMSNSLDQYLPYQDMKDGTFMLVIAGHTRTLAIQMLQEENPGKRYLVNAKIHSAKTPGEIIALQLGENFHSKTPLERNAILIVEAYRYGVQQGEWETPAEFLSKNKGKYSKNMLSDAIGFARLPTAARDFVFSGYLNYAAAVELGKSGDVIADNVLANLDPSLDVNAIDRDSVPQNIKSMFETAYRDKLSKMIAHIGAEGLGSANAIRYIRGQVNTMLEQSAKLRGELDQQDSMFDMSMMSSAEQQQQYLQGLKKELQDVYSRMVNVQSADEMLQLHSELANVDTASSRDTLRRSRERLARAIGSVPIDYA